MKITNGKTYVTAEDFLDDIHSSCLKYSVGEPDQFSDINIHRMRINVRILAKHAWCQ